ncbi:MAG: hypothetical protein H7282_14725 [Cytophagaceae bacterium]|nr:hypothetical protein [Cytophagaceae bacterium]
MQTLLFFAIVFVLIAVTVEDFRSRLVHAFWFPALFLLAFGYAIQFESSAQVIEQVLISFSFLIIQGFLLIIYFIIKHKRWINITQSYLGWGDILFIIASIPLFSSFVFVLFYLCSLLLTILWVVLYRLTGKQMVLIPLAGIQSICLLGAIFYHQYMQLILFNDYTCLPLML